MVVDQTWFQRRDINKIDGDIESSSQSLAKLAEQVDMRRLGCVPAHLCKPMIAHFPSRPLGAFLSRS